MASMPPPHQTQLDYLFPTDLYQDFPPPPALSGCATTISDGLHALTSWSSDQLESYPFTFFDDYAPGNDVSASSFQSERHDNMAVPVLPADLQQQLNMHGLCGAFQGFGYQNGGGLRAELVDDYCFRNDGFKSTSPSSEDNWRYQCHKTQSVEESNIKVGRYSAEERKDRILRYLKKRNQRNFNKTIKYACRKTLADRRVRVRGRFARNNELSEEETITKNKVNGVLNHQESEFFSGEAIQLKHDDEGWLQEAMASLMYLPCV